MMKVVHVITTINRGGAENHLSALVTEQVKQGLDVTVIYLKGDGYWTKYFESLNVKTICLGLKYYGHINPLIKLIAALKEITPDIVHAHMPPAELYARTAMLFSFKAPTFIISKHNDEPFYKGPFSGILGRWVARRAKKVIAISDSVNQYMLSNLSLPPSKVRTIHYGIDTVPYENITPSETEKLKTELFGTANDVMIIGTIARLVPQKSLHTLIQAYAEFRKIATVKSKLVFVGNGPLEAELKRLSLQLDVENAITWLGFREDIPKVLSTFDIFTLTSIYEGFGLVLLEAMAAAKPIVASKVSAIPEIVSNETGHLVAAQDVAGFCQAFKAIENESIRKSLGTAGLQRAKKHFTLEAMSRKTLALYEEILAK